MMEKNQDSAQKLWCVNVQGPDDVYAMPDVLSALQRANELNVFFGKQDAKSTTPHLDPIMRAVVIEWPHSAESHAESVSAPPVAAPTQITGDEWPEKARNLVKQYGACSERFGGSSGMYMLGAADATTKAKEALLAHLAASPVLPSADMVMVPREPTEEMIEAVMGTPWVVDCSTTIGHAGEVVTVNKEFRHQRYIVDGWKAMLAASQPSGSGGGE